MLVELTKTKKPALWEEGGGFSNTGSATIVADKNGGKKRPLFVRNKGHLACEKHALVPLHVGDVVVTVWRHRDTYDLQVVRIVSIVADQATVETICAVKGSAEQCLAETPDIFKAAVSAALKKSAIYHCRYPVFVQEAA